MWIRKAPYLLNTELPLITHHENLPAGAKELARIIDPTTSGDLWVIVKQNENKLSLVKTYILNLDTGPKYSCHQQDFPLEFLSWFPQALIEFQKPPSEGGLHAGAMTTPDINVAGEMLCLQRALGVDQDRGGYAVLNRSRCRKNRDPETSFTPHEVCWASRFLYEGGLLDLIKDLGQKLVDGKL